MNDSNLAAIREIYKHKWALNHGDTAEKETAQFWNRKAAAFASQVHSTAARVESLEFLQQFNWSRDETVLDVAAGPGTFAIPLAPMVKEIVATDFSDEMLGELQKQAATENVTNIKTIAGRWLEIAKPGVFNTVLCLNSLGVITTDAQHNSQLAAALRKLRDCCAQRFIMLIPHADSPLDAKMRQILELDEVSMESRRIAVLYFAMVDCGMLPDLQIMRRPASWTFAGLPEARQTLLKKAGLSDTDKVGSRFDQYLQEVLLPGENGLLSLPYNISQALFVWERP